jgi:hypothetical protein
LEKTLTDQNPVHEEIESTLQSGNACYHSKQNVFQLANPKHEVQDIHDCTAAVLCGCETWSLALREKRGLSVFDNRVLRRKFRPKRDEVTGEWRKLHSEELNDLYCSPSIV